MAILEELLPAEVLEQIREVLLSDEWSFGSLVAIGELNPAKDFRHGDLRDLDLRDEDLRGFDFTGADLRGCIRNDGTKIDATTILDGALIDWVEEQKTPIVQVMLEIEHASNSSRRRRALELLVSQYQSAQHINAYLRNAIRKTKSQETFFDLADFFKPSNSGDDELLRGKLRELLLQASRRRKYNFSSQVSPLRVSNIMQSLSETNNDTLSEVFTAVREKTLGKEIIQLNPDKFVVSMELVDILAAIESRQKRNFL